MPEIEHIFRQDLKICDRVQISEGIPVVIILQALAEYACIPNATPAILQILKAYEMVIVNPVFAKEREAEAQRQVDIAQSMQTGIFNQIGVQLPPTASDLSDPDN